MKKRVIFIAIIIAFSSFGFIEKSKTKKSVFTIHELINNPKVLVKLVSNGGHSGECVSLNIDSKLNKNFTVKIPQGTLFYPKDEGEQTLILPKTEMIAVNKQSSKSVLVNGFCIESNDKSPKKEGVFKVGKSNDEKLKKLFAFLKTKDYDKNQIQESIWCITDGQSLGNIYEEESTELKEIVANLTGREIPWQSTRREIVVDEQQNIVVEPVEIKGQIKFGTKRVTKVKSKIIRSNGELVHEFSKVMTIPKADNITFNFNVKVKGWEQGKYYVVYFTDQNKDLVKQEFTL